MSVANETRRVRNQGHLFVCSLTVGNLGVGLTQLQFSDEYADTEIDIHGDRSVKGCLNDLKSLKKRHPDIKTILSVGGGGEGSAPFPSVAGNSIVRSSFAQSARQMVDAFEFDGIDSKLLHELLGFCCS